LALAAAYLSAEREVERLREALRRGGYGRGLLPPI
jgi:hypothetical protein